MALSRGRGGSPRGSALLKEPTPLVSVPRYAPRRPLPPYRFVPGLNPHPSRDRKGHSYRGGAPEPRPPRLPPERWRENEEYLHGCDLYNHAYWWEAHEAWEGLWHLTRKSETEGLFLQGLIQVSAAHLKRHMAEAEGSAKLARLALEKLRVVEAAVLAGSQREGQQKGTYMGLEVSPFVKAVERYLIERDESAPWPVIALGA
jgi:uncharacterized protein